MKKRLALDSREGRVGLKVCHLLNTKVQVYFSSLVSPPGKTTGSATFVSQSLTLTHLIKPLEPP